MRAALLGFLRAGEPNSRRARLCILAEPGAVALLVYAIGRLLPAQIAGSFAFSTYEPPAHVPARKQGGPRDRQLRAERRRSHGSRQPAAAADTSSTRCAMNEDPDLAVAADWPLEGLDQAGGRGRLEERG